MLERRWAASGSIRDSSPKLIRGRARRCSSSLVELPLFPCQVSAHKPKSEGKFLNSTPPKPKSLLSSVQESLSVRSFTPDTGQEVGSYTCERRSVVHGLLMAANSSDGWFVPSVRAPTDLHGSVPHGTVPSFPE